MNEHTIPINIFISDIFFSFFFDSDPKIKKKVDHSKKEKKMCSEFSSMNWYNNACLYQRFYTHRWNFIENPSSHDHFNAFLFLIIFSIIFAINQIITCLCNHIYTYCAKMGNSALVILFFPLSLLNCFYLVFLLISIYCIGTCNFIVT